MRPRIDPTAPAVQTTAAQPAGVHVTCAWPAYCLGMAVLSMPALALARPGGAPDLILPAYMSYPSAARHVQAHGDDSPSRQAMRAVARGMQPTVVIPGRPTPRTRSLRSVRSANAAGSIRRRAVRAWPEPRIRSEPADLQVSFHPTAAPAPAPAAFVPPRQRAQRMFATPAASGNVGGDAEGMVAGSRSGPRALAAKRPLRRQARRMLASASELPPPASPMPAQPIEDVPATPLSGDRLIAAVASLVPAPIPVLPGPGSAVLPAAPTESLAGEPQPGTTQPAESTPGAQPPAVANLAGSLPERVLARAARFIASTHNPATSTIAVATPVAAAAALPADEPQVLSMKPDASLPPVPLRAYRYEPPQVQEAADAPARPPEQQRLIDLNLAGDYAKLGREGLALMRRQTLDPELRFIIANGLAWSGRLHEAEKIYPELLGTPYKAKAMVAMANIQRWRGKNTLAAPVYREVLAADPDNQEARTGLDLIERSMRPRLRIETTSTGDYGRITALAQPASGPAVPVTYSTRSRTLGSRINYRWVTDGGLREWEIEASSMRANLPGVSAHQPLLTGRVQAHDVSFDPALEVSLGDSIYLTGSMRIGNSPFRLHGGNVNWGQMAFNARALDERLSALNVGVGGNFSNRAGRFGLMFDHYQVSDSNQVQTGLFRYSPPFKLFSRHLRPVIGLEHRKTRFASPAYWSPEQGYGLGYAGVEAEWSHERWDLSASLQRGWRLYGEAGPSWGAAIGGRYDFDRHWTAGARAWFIRSQREQAPYRAGVITLFVERRW